MPSTPTTPTSRLELTGYFSRSDSHVMDEPLDPADISEYHDFLTKLTNNRRSNSRGDDHEDIEALNVEIPGFSGLEVLCPTTEEFLYTLIGRAANGESKRLRFAPGNEGRARLRLRHELDVLRILQEHAVERAPQPEQVTYLPTRAICSIYSVRQTRSFQEFVDQISKTDWILRLGSILKFAQSLATTLAESHTAGIFRTTSHILN